MIVRINNRGNRHYDHYGIVYRMATDNGRHLILLLVDDKGSRCIKPGFGSSDEIEGIPQEDERAFDAWPQPLQDTNVHSVACELSDLVEDGRKYRKIKELLKDSPK